MGNRKTMCVGMFLYLGAHFFLTYFQILLYKRDYTTGHVFSWDSAFAIVGACGLAMAVMSIEYKKEWIKKAICYVGKNTFYIYLIHMMIIGKLNVSGFSIWLLTKTGDQAIGEILYTICYISIVFLISLCISSIVLYIQYVVKYIWKKRKNRDGEKNGE